MLALLGSTTIFLMWCVTPAPAQEKDSILTVIVNKSNSMESISKRDLRALLLGEVAEWPNKQPIVVVEREPNSEAFQKTLKLILHMSPGEYQRWLLQAEFRGEKLPLIKTLNSDEGAKKFVFNVPGALAITDSVPTSPNSSQTKVLRIEGKLPGDPGYDLK